MKATHSPQWLDKGTYKEPTDDDNIRVPRLEVDDATTYIDKDVSDNMTLTDAVTGTKTLAELSAAGGGDVTGPSSSTDNAIARFHSTTGKVIQDYTSGAPTIGDTGIVVLGGDFSFKIDPVSKIFYIGDGVDSWDDGVAFKYVGTDIMAIRKGDDGGYGSTYLATLFPYAIEYLGAGTFKTDNADGRAVVFSAIDDDGAAGAYLEVAKMQSANDPYWSMGGSQEFKFYNSGIADLGNGALTNVNIDSGTLGGVTLDGAIAGGGQVISALDRQNYNETNLLENGDFEVGDPPTGWSAGYSATLAQEGGAGLHPIGAYSIKVTVAGGETNAWASQDLADPTRYQGRTIAIGAWIYVPSTISAGAVVRIALRDDRGNFSSASVPHDDAWHWTTRTVTVDAVVTYVGGIVGYIAAGDPGDYAYADGAILVEGDSCPAFSDKPINTYDAITLRQALDANSNAITNHAQAIADNAILTVDHVTPVATDYARFTANGLEGREKSEVLGDLNVADGADVTGSTAPQAHKASHQAGGGDILYVPRTYVWFVKGTVATGTEQGATFRIKRATTVEDVELHIKTAPTGAALIVDINDGGTTLFDEGDSGVRPEIDIDGTTEDGNHVFSDTALAAGTELTMDVDQVGSTIAGSDLTVLLHVIEAVA